jgi:hypothetical protein
LKEKCQVNYIVLETNVSIWFFSSTEVKPFVETVAVKPNLSIENDVEKYIRAEVYSTQMRIKDFFEDFDKLRKGWVTEDKVIFFPPNGSHLSIHRVSASL